MFQASYNHEVSGSMSDSQRGLTIDLSRELSEFLVECQTVGRTMASAGEALGRLEALPAPGILEDFQRLREDLQSLVEHAVAGIERYGEQDGPAPGRDAGLDQVLAYIQGAVKVGEKRSARSAEVLDLLGKVARLTLNDGADFPALAEVRSRAVELSERIEQSTLPASIPEFVELSGGTHFFRHLISLVENVELDSREREESLIEVASSSKEVARAARSRRLTIGLAGTSPLESPSPSKPVAPIEIAEQPPKALLLPDDLGGHWESPQIRQEEHDARDDATVDGVRSSSIAPSSVPTPSETERDASPAVRTLPSGGVEKAMQRGTSLVPRSGVNRPVINKNPFSTKRGSRGSTSRSVWIADRTDST